MVHVEFWRPGSEIGQSECVATLTQRGREAPRIEGREPQVVDLERMVPSVRTGETISFEPDPEEWLGAWPGFYRSPYLRAEIVHDEPPPSRGGWRTPGHRSPCA